MPTIAEIAALALDGVSSAIPDAIVAGTLAAPDTKGAWDSVAAEYTTTPGATYSGRVLVEQTRPIATLFPDYVAGPGEVLVMLEGFGVVPTEEWRLTYGGKARSILRVLPLMGASDTSYAVVR